MTQIVLLLGTSNNLSAISTNLCSVQQCYPCLLHYVACCNIGAGPASDCSLEGSAGTGSGQQETALQGWWPQGSGSGAHGHGEVPPHGPPAGDVSAITPPSAVPPSTAPPSTVNVAEYCNSKDHADGCSCLLSFFLPVAETWGDCDGRKPTYQWVHASGCKIKLSAQQLTPVSAYIVWSSGLR